GAGARRRSPRGPGRRIFPNAAPCRATGGRSRARAIPCAVRTSARSPRCTRWWMASSATSGPRSSPLPIRRCSCPPGRPGRLADRYRDLEAEAAAPPPRGSLGLTVDRLTKQFGGFTALNAVSFEVKEGEILGLIGPNGSGKTTCFNCISGALAATAGSIRFRGDEIAGLTPDAICHRGLARTFQIPRPFRKLSILENVAVAAHFGAARRSTEAEARR